MSVKETSKVCFKCGKSKPLSMFYKHPRMADGHLNKCKECTKKDVSGNYRENIDHYKMYEAIRIDEPARRQSCKEKSERDKEHRKIKLEGKLTSTDSLL